MLKKGDLTINIIVIAVVALLVLVILVAIFSGKMSIFTSGTTNATQQTCSGVGGNPNVPFTDSCPTGTTHSPGAYSDVRAGYKCCV